MALVVIATQPGAASYMPPVTLVSVRDAMRDAKQMQVSYM